jgi:CHRD domain
MKISKGSIQSPARPARGSVILRNVPVLVLAGVLLIAGSCKKSDTANPNVIFKATLNGASETPANASTATGTATLTFNTNTKIFSIVVTFSGVTATASHIHKGDVGVAGNVVFGFTTPITSPINYTSVALDASQEADLNANLYYVNIHSSAFPGGEIRGQLIKQ